MQSPIICDSYHNIVQCYTPTSIRPLRPLILLIKITHTHTHAQFLRQYKPVNSTQKSSASPNKNVPVFLRTKFSFNQNQN